MKDTSIEVVFTTLQIGVVLKPVMPEQEMLPTEGRVTSSVDENVK